MVELEIRDYANYDAFARNWHADTLEQHGVTLAGARERDLLTEDETRLRWQLLGQLASDELLIVLPEWLADEKTGFVDGRLPTEFVGRIERETEKAIRLADATAARPLMRLAHRITRLEGGPDHTDPDRRAWVTERLAEHRRAFEDREDMPGLSDGWLPKSQIIAAVRRR